MLELGNLVRRISADSQDLSCDMHAHSMQSSVVLVATLTLTISYS